MRILFAIIIFLTTSRAAYAGIEPYVALGAEIGEYETENPSNQYPATLNAAKYTDVAINGRLGVDIGPYFGAELEGAIHLGGGTQYSAMDEDGLGGFEGENDVKSRLLLFLRGGVPVSDQVKIFARAGLGFTSRRDEYRGYGIYQFDGTPYDDTYVYKDLAPAGALGIGAEYRSKPDSKSAIRADLTYQSSYIGGEDQDIDSTSDMVFSLAYVRRF